MANIPYDKNQLLKWSAFRIERPASLWERNGFNKLKDFSLVRTTLLDLVKTEGYEQFKDKLNWLYNNYSAKNYQLVWKELQDYNEKRKADIIPQVKIERAEYLMQREIVHWRQHFGDIPAWIQQLTDNQRQLLLDRARTCYELVPEEVILESMQMYTVPERVIKDISHEGITYYSQEELYKSKYNTNNLVDVAGRVKVHSIALQRLAEDAVIRDAHWLSQYDNTDNDLRAHREVEDTPFEERMQLAIEYVTKHKGKMPADELLSTALYLYDLKPDECNHNRMVPIADMQGPDSPYSIHVELRDFQESIYEDDTI